MSGVRTLFSRFLADYGIVLALLLLCLYFSWVTQAEQQPTGAAGGRQLAQEVGRLFPQTAGTTALLIVRDNQEDALFAQAAKDALEQRGVRVVGVVRGEPAQARQALQQSAERGEALSVIACHPTTATWAVFDRLGSRFPAFAQTKIAAPRSYRGSNFLKTDNLLNIANQIAVIAILAIGMTLVIITGGIDLSVGSLIALSAVVSTLLIREVAGAESASAFGMIWCSLAGVALCGGMGLFTGAMVTVFRIPPFIVTLAMMLVANGLAFIFAKGQSIYQVPPSFIRLGRGSDFGLPNAVLLMGALYGIAHLFMARTQLGRYIYAVGNNAEAARLSGVPVTKVLLFVYWISGLLAGLGGIVMASQLKSGSPTYGVMYELYVVAAVVVGGTSLSGGQGKVFGTLLGAFLIAVIQNGMNLTGVESYTQKVALGLVILGAVLLDRLKRRSWRSAGA